MKNSFISKLWILLLLSRNSVLANKPPDGDDSPFNETEHDTEGLSKESLQLDFENIFQDQSVDQELLQVSKIKENFVEFLYKDTDAAFFWCTLCPSGIGSRPQDSL